MRMLDAWSCSENESVCSSHESSYSDKIDSDIEAELYSSIHHQKNCAFITSEVDSIMQRDDIVSNQNNQILIPKNSSYQTVNSFTSDTCENDTFYVSFESPATTRLNRNTDAAIINAHSASTYVKHISKFAELLKNRRNGVIKNTCNKNKHDDNMEEPDQSKVKWIAVASSDSDSDSSVIWIDPKEMTPRDLKTNLLTSNATIPEDFNTADNFLSVNDNRRPYTDRKNMSLPNMEVRKNSKDIWHVDAEDILKGSKRFSRFFNQTSSVCCSICGKMGHSESLCSFRITRCFICGGQHVIAACKDKICPKCYGKGHDSKGCRIHRNVFCSHCNMRSHHTSNCPDIWRRYHLTTNTAEIVAGKPLIQNTPIYCFNCGDQGHFGPMCKTKRKPQLGFPTWPSVISYTNISKESSRSTKENEIKHNGKNFRRNLRKKEKRKKMKEESAKLLSEEKEKLNEKKLKSWRNFCAQKKLKKKEPSFPRSPKDIAIKQEESVNDDQALRELKKQFSRRYRGKRHNKNNAV